MSREEADQLAEMFSKIGVKPKAATPEELKQWMSEYVAAQSDAARADDTGDERRQQPSTVVVGRKPWLTKFSGENSDTYALWRYQLRSLVEEGHRERDIQDAIRASIHGKAGHVLISLGTSSSVTTIMKKMDSVFGDTDDKADALSAFYGAQQGKTETVTDWGCRLEGLLQIVERQSKGSLGNTDEMLRTKFWSGLRQELKDLSAYQFDKSTNFDDLRMALRKIEKSHVKQKPTQNTNAVQLNTEVKMESNDMKTLIATVNKLSATVEEIVKEKQQAQDQSEHNQQQQAGYGRKGRGRGRGQNADSTFTCWKCGGPNHIAVHCRARVDHLPQDFSSGLGRRGGRGAQLNSPNATQ